MDESRRSAVDDDINAAAAEFYRGNRYMLFEAIRRCAQYGVPMPAWIRQELEAGLKRYNSGEVRDFGDAFGVVREKGTNMSAVQSRYKHGWDLYQTIEDEKRRGATLEQALQTAAARFPMSEGTAKNVYYEVREVVEKVRSGF